MSRGITFTILAIILISLGAAIIIFLARGYRFDLVKKEVQKTGIIAATSAPDGAKIYLDGKLVGATNTTLSLSPKIFEIKLVKEGYQVWQKKVLLKEELVLKIEAVLFPVAPELKPLTFSGVSFPVLSGDGLKIVYYLGEPAEKAGFWLLNLGQAPFNFSQTQIQLTKEIPNFAPSEAKIFFSPNSQNILVSTPKTAYLLDTARLSINLADISLTQKEILKTWQEEVNQKEMARLLRLTPVEQKLATTGAILTKDSPEVLNYIPFGIVWSADEEKYYYKNNQNQLVIVDIKEKKEAKISAPRFVFWYPDSAHLVLVEENLISLIEIDGANKTAVYSGRFENDFVFPWPGSGRLVILTSFNQLSGTEPNLYTVNLK